MNKDGHGTDTKDLMNYSRYSELYYNDEHLLCRCNWCGAVFEEGDILIEKETLQEYCPECLVSGCIMDLGVEE